MKRLLLIAALVAGCGGTTTPTGLISQTSTTTPADLATEEPLATEAPVVDPAAGPQGSDLSVKVTKRTASVAPNGMASISIKTTKNAHCDIVVAYASGPSSAKGLATKTADSSGLITWSWKVGSHTTAGTWPITITCALGDRSGTVDTEFTVT